jgi:hypothetical protein
MNLGDFAHVGFDSISRTKFLIKKGGLPNGNEVGFPYSEFGQAIKRKRLSYFRIQEVAHERSKSFGRKCAWIDMSGLILNDFHDEFAGSGCEAQSEHIMPRGQIGVI